VKNKTVAASFIDHPANVVLRAIRTSRGWKRHVLLGALASFALLQIVLAWFCLPFWLLVRLSGPQRRPAKQVLIIAMGGIGDNVLAMPFIRSLKQRYPGRTISLVIRPIAAGFSELLTGVVDREFHYRFGVTPASRLLEPLRALSFVAHHGLAINTEMAVVPNWGTDVCGGGFIAFFSRATRRITFAGGGGEKEARNFLYSTLYTSRFRSPAAMHERAKLEGLFGEDTNQHLTFGIEAQPSDIAQPHILERRSETLSVVLAPFTGHPRKNWPVERWIAVVRELGQLHPRAEFLILGGPDDQVAAEAIAQDCLRTTSLCGKLSFLEITEVLQRSWVFVGGDTGVTHLAALVQATIVVLFCHPLGALPSHYNSPERFAPLSNNVTVIRPKPSSGCAVACEALKACCILNINVQEVVVAVENALACFLSDARQVTPGNYANQ
jgi:ADP-heptose:LPS heptosyltransferase